MKITLNEEPRVFSVRIGNSVIGQITSHAEKGEDTEDAYFAERVTDDTVEEPYEGIGYYSTLKEAGVAVVSFEYGPSKIDKVTERIV